MSFRARLISFFVVIVVVPMLAMGALVLRLISDSQQGKADARAAGLATAAAGVYQSAIASARADATLLARDPALLHSDGSQLAALAARAGLDRVVITRDRRVVASVGDPSAIAPGVTEVRVAGGRTPVHLQVEVSTLSASQYTRQFASSAAGVVVRQGGHTLGSSLDVAASQALPRRGTVSVDGVRYRALTQRFAGFGTIPISVTVLSSLAATNGSLSSSKALAAAFIGGFLLLALAFALLSSRALQGQITRFLHAARRLGSGDFSAPVPSEGHDEFAALAQEFNSMSEQLERRLEELSEERARLRESVRRIGQTFAANLDRPALLDLALMTALDATRGGCGRVSVRDGADDPLVEAAREGSLEGLERLFYEAEHAALNSEELGRRGEGDIDVLSAALRPGRRGSRAHGLVTVARRGLPFTEDEADLLRSLAGQAALALENVDLHVQVTRQAVTDELTGVANHGRFQELLSAETEQVRRYHHSLGLIMVDLDNFKTINDTYGHPQGDLVLREVGGVLRENSRDADWPARYGGEELALILPHTDLEGAYVIAERIRAAISELRIAHLDGGPPLRVTASVGVAASTEGDKDRLIASADAALYEAKRRGKNRTVRAQARPADVVGAE